MQPAEETLRQPGGLAERLKRLRRDAGLTGAALATRAGWPRSKVPKLENGRQMPSEGDVRKWAEACGHPEEIPELLDLRSEARAVHEQWAHVLRGGQAADQERIGRLTRAAGRIRNFEIMLIPGLLQTSGYARYRALETVRLHGTDPAKVDEVVAARMRRQDVLYDTGKTFEFCICEAALRYLLCPPQVMAGQLDRLLALSGLPNVTLAIIPPGTELPVAPMAGFISAGGLTITETFTAAETYAGREAEKHDEIMDALMAEAATGDEARQLIAAAAADLRR